MFLPRSSRFALASAAAVLALIGHAGAADTATVRIVANGSEESVEVAMDDLKVGESRQLTAASGKPAIVTRTENGLTVEVAGKRTEVVFPAAGGDVHWVHAHGDAHDGKQVRVIRIDRDAEVTDLGDGKRKVIMIKRGSADASGLDDAGIAELIAELQASKDAGDDARIKEIIAELEAKHATVGDGEHEQVIVTRRITRPADQQD